jgi:tRNA(Arg) A34 adenosine deaminase TadA
MRRAIELSRERMEDGAGAYCASLVVRDGEVVGEGWNNVAIDNDPTGHCEMNAMRAAGRRLGRWDLSGCDLYTTWEPCPMCVAAIWCARIDRVYYANLLTDAERLGMDIAGLVRESRAPLEERSRPYERLLGEEAWAVVDSWWKSGRATPILGAEA